MEEKKFFNEKIKQITYERLLEFFEEDYTMSYNQMIKGFQKDPNISYEFIDIQMIHAVRSYSRDERENGMCQKTLKYIKKIQSKS